MDTTQGSKQLFVFRFRKFNSSVFYDPQLDLGSSNDTSGDTTDLKVGEFTAKILGRSGKMTIGRGANPDIDADRIQVTFDEIKEIDSSGTAVGISGATKHTFNTFASLDFNFSSIRDDTFGGLSAKRIDFSASIGSVSALLAVNVYIFKEKGEINVDGEKSSVQIGSVKFNIQLVGWDFCGNPGITCNKEGKNEIGDGIEFVISVQGKGSAQKRPDNDQNKRTDGDEYQMGGNAALILSKKVIINHNFSGFSGRDRKNPSTFGKAREVATTAETQSNVVYFFFFWKLLLKIV